MKIAFISALFGMKNTNTSPAKFSRVKDADYFLFSDRHQGDLNTSWSVIDASKIPNIVDIQCDIRKSRYVKFMGWQLLHEMGKSYDVIYFSDVSWSPKTTINWKDISRSITGNPFPWAQALWSNTNSGNILKDCELIVKYGRDTHDSIDRTIRFFKTKYPEISLNETPYYENTIFGYIPCKTTQNLTMEFWQLYINNNITHRDQPLWNLLLKDKNLTPVVIDMRSLFEETGIYR